MTRSFHRTVLVVGLVLLSLLVGGCRSCSRPRPLATLATKSGQVERDYADRLRQWVEAPVGATFSMGDAVQTLSSSEALLAMDDASEVKLEPDTSIRFMESAPGEPRGVDVEAGEVEWMTSESPAAIRTSFGNARLESGGRLSIRRRDGALHFEVKVGRATFQDRAGSVTELTSGRAFIVEVGRAVLEPVEERPAPPPPPPSPSVAAASSPALNGIGPGIDAVDVVITAGETVVIHDPRPPTAVRYSFGAKCPSGGALESKTRGKGAQAASGADATGLLLPPGTSDYTLRCTGRTGLDPNPVASGSVTVIHDAGTRAMPVSAPMTALVADGRSYTVLYQNQAPKVTLRWPEAPAETTPTLRHTFAGGTKITPAPQGVASFPSGSLREGSHVFVFEGGGKVSRRTQVQLRFDNAAPKAMLNVPAEVGVRAGESLAVSGITLPGWAVEVEGRALEQDGQGRFSVSVPMPSDRNALAVRLTHPRRGTHIYLRRSASP